MKEQDQFSATVLLIIDLFGVKKMDYIFFIFLTFKK